MILRAFSKAHNGSHRFQRTDKGEPGHHTFFVYTHQGEMDWWQPVNIYIENTRKAPPIQTLQISVPKMPDG